VREGGHDVAAIVPLEDLAVLEELEEAADVNEARRRLADPDDTTLAYEQVRRELGRDKQR
jgi:hypothetical protein